MALAQARLRSLAGLLAALLIAVLVTGPGLDAMLCAGDGLEPAAAARTIVHHEHGLLIQHLHRGGHDESPSGCQHGHVQAANACAETGLVLTATRVALVLRQGHGSGLLPSSAPQPGLERPPRA